MTRDLDRVTFESDGTLDEVVLSDASVHLELMSVGKKGRKTYMLIVENDKDHIHLTIGRAKDMFVYERFDYPVKP